MMLLRHYGSTQYCPDSVGDIENRQHRNKPIGGLWTSPVDSEFGWIDWCESEDYAHTNFDEYFDLVFEGRLLVINGEYDLRHFTWCGASKWLKGIDFIKLLPDYDAIHLTAQGQWSTRLSEPYDLYGWDCESVLILNKESVRVTS